METIHEENQMEILSHFHSMITKNEQDLFLQSLIDVDKINQRRPRKEEGSKKNAAAFKYNAMVGTSRIQVCLNAFLSLHGKTKKQVERL